MQKWIHNGPMLASRNQKVKKIIVHKIWNLIEKCFSFPREFYFSGLRIFAFLHSRESQETNAAAVKPVPADFKCAIIICQIQPFAETPLGRF